MAHFQFAHSRCLLRNWFVPPLAAFSLLLSGCANQAETASEAQAGFQDDQAPRCEIGKCDGLTGEIKDYYTDMRSLSLDDLAGLGVGYTTDALNDALAVIPYVDLELEPTSFFGLSERELFGEVTVESLSQLQAGLTERLGETAFATRVNAIRQKSLQAGYGEVFAESLFRIKGELSHQLEMDAGDTVGTVGFTANPTLEAMVIAPVAGELEGIWRGPLEAVRASRGFVLPRSRQDIEAMIPGSSVALRGEGSLALNLGLGLPIYVAGLGSHLTLTARISAGARAGLRGRLDVQLIRGEGDEVFVDVGLSSASIRHYELALSSGWGVEGLPIVELDLGPLTVNLSELLSRSMEKQLNAHLSPFDLRSSEGREKSRLSVARFRLELSAGVEAEQALAQALRGDIRLAQALANRPKSGVEQLVDLTRDVQSESDYMGFRFLSMRFFKNELERRGVVHVSENGEGQTLLFNELSSESGFFFTNRGVAWRRLTELKSRNGQLVSAQNNARLTLSEADRFLSKDQVLDHIDPLLGWFIGQDQILDTLSPTADGLFYFADHHCGRPPSRDPDNRREREAYERCVDTLSETSEFVSFFEEGSALWASVAREIRGDFTQPFPASSEVARRLFDLKMGISGVHEAPNAFLTGPKGSLSAQIRFSQRALDQLMAFDAPARFRANAETILKLMQLNRDQGLEKKQRNMARYIERQRDDIDPMIAAYERLVENYQRYHQISELRFLDTQRIDLHAHLLQVPLNAPKESSIASVAEFQGELIETLFNALQSSLGRVGEPDGFIVGYGLLSLVQPNDVELLVSYRFDPEADAYAPWETQLYSRGDAPLIDAGRFDLDRLLHGE